MSDKKFKNAIQLNSQDDYIESLSELIKNTSRTLRIRTVRLDSDLFNHQEITDLLSTFARRSRYSQIYILIDHPEELAKYHCLTLNLARRLSEKIIFKTYFDKDKLGYTDTIITADNGHYLIKPQDDSKTGYYSDSDTLNTKSLVDTFDHAWGLSSVATQLRQLNLG